MAPSKDRSSSRHEPRSRRGLLLPMLVVVVSIGVALTLAVLLYKVEDAHQRGHFERTADDYANLLARGIHAGFRPVQHLATVLSYQTASVSGQSFGFWAGTISSVYEPPGVIALQWVPQTRTPDGAVRFPIEHSFRGSEGEPEASDDLLSDPIQRQAVESALASNWLAFSAWYLHDGEIRFRVLRPVIARGAREGELVGLASGVYRVERMLLAVLEPVGRAPIEIFLADDTGLFPGFVHYVDGEVRYVSQIPEVSRGGRRFAEKIDIDGTAWPIVITAQPGAYAVSLWLPLFVGLSTLLFGGLLASYLANLTLREQRVRLLVQERTQALSNSEARYRLLVETLPYGLLEIGENGTIRYANSAFEKTFGYRFFEVTEKPVWEFVPEAEQSRFKNTVREILSGKEPMPELLLHHLLSKGGDVREVESAWSLCPDPEVCRLLLVMTDVTERKRAEEELKLAASVFGVTTEGIMVTDADNRIEMVNPSFTQITGYTAEDVLGKDPRVLASGHQGADFYREMWQSLNERGRWAGEIINRRKNGEIYTEWLSIVKVCNDTCRHVAVFSDITKHKQAEEVIRWQAHYDPLTRLPNRTLFLERLDHALSHALRAKNVMALLFVDLDHFKWVNDTLGHTAGDELLMKVARHLENSARRSDTVARLGGDEFAVIMENVRRSEDAERVARAILERLNKPFLLENMEVYISACIGIAEYPLDGDSAERLFKNADSAMYQAKVSGRNTFRFYTPQVNEGALQRLSLEAELRRALERNELQVFYQPVIDSQRGCVASLEALLRWQTADGSPVLPETIIALAEDVGLIIPIGERVLRIVCDDQKRWQDQGLGQLPVAVNLSARQCFSNEAMLHLLQILHEARVAPQTLTLEITESVLLGEEEGCVGRLKRLREAGVRVAVDDFGTGYSSLSYLKRLPVDSLKVDKGFVHDVDQDPNSAALVEAILAMAHALGMTVVAEGVETEAQAVFLREHGCDFQQGFRYAHPMASDSLSYWLEESKRTVCTDSEMTK